MKKKIIISVISIVIIIIAVFAMVNIKSNINKKEIEDAIHGVVIVDEVPFYSKAKTSNVKQISLLKKSENVYILDEFEK